MQIYNYLSFSEKGKKKISDMKVLISQYLRFTTHFICYFWTFR
jgi:hypothetical protein